MTRQNRSLHCSRFRSFICAVALFLSPSLLIADGAHTFEQTNWAGGQTQGPVNNTPWTAYFSKDALLSVVNSGADLVVVGPVIFQEHTTDSDFALAPDSMTHTSDTDFTTAVSGVAPVLTNVTVADGSVRLASGQTGGTYRSTLMDAGTHYGFRNVQFSATVPSGTKLTADGDSGQFTATVAIRAGNSTNPDDGSWTNWLEVASGFTIGELREARYIQYEARLDTNNADVSPALNDITFNYLNYASGRNASDFAEGVEVAGDSVVLKAGFNSGEYYSSIIDLGKFRPLTTLDFDKAGTVNVLVRAGTEASPTASPTAWTSWQSVSGTGDSIAGLGLRQYVQYKAELVSGSTAPSLDRVRLNYRDDPEAPASLASSRVDTRDPGMDPTDPTDNHIDSIRWIEDATLPGNSDVRFQIATGATPGDITGASFVGPDGTSNSYWNSTNTNNGVNGGCFKYGIWVACTRIPAALQDGSNDEVFAYKMTIVPSDNTDPNGPTSPVVSEIIVRYGNGSLYAVTVSPITDIELEEPPPASTATVGVVLHTEPATDVTIDFVSSDTGEVTVSPASLTFNAGNWDTPQELTLTSIDDGGAVDGDQTVIIAGAVAAGSDPNYIGVTVDDITVTNVDDDKLIATIVATDANAAELGQDPGTFTISVNNPAPANTNINFTVSGTANHAGSDYTPVLVSPATILTGQQSTTLTITPVDDTFMEGNETIIVILATGTNYDIGSPGSATVTIIDDDVPPVPSVTVTASSTNAREANGQTSFFTIHRTGLTNDPLPVFFSVEGTATYISDYTGPFGSATAIIPSGFSNIVLTVTPVNDGVAEGNETVILTVSADGVSGSSYLVGSPNSAIVTIIDADAATDSGGGGGGGATAPLVLLLGLIYLYLLGVIALPLRRRVVN